MEGIYRCACCGIEKHTSSFYKDKRARRGHKNKCIDCCKADYVNRKDAILKRMHDRKEETKILRRERYEKNKKEINRKHVEYEIARKKLDPTFRIAHNIRTAIGDSFRRGVNKKSKRTESILGCSFEEFKNHLEAQFENWMTWENYGMYNGAANYGWDIDHIIPISSAVTVDDVHKLNHYTNLRPLCSYENRVVKKDKIIDYAI